MYGFNKIIVPQGKWENTVMSCAPAIGSVVWENRTYVPMQSSPDAPIDVVNACYVSLYKKYGRKLLIMASHRRLKKYSDVEKYLKSKLEK